MHRARAWIFELTSHAAEQVEERKIRLEWIERALQYPDRTDPDRSDFTVSHALKRIPEMDGRVLRVVHKPRTIPVIVITVFFDRRWRWKL